jgi:hypothetical protein
LLILSIKGKFSQVAPKMVENDQKPSLPFLQAVFLHMKLIEDNKKAKESKGDLTNLETTLRAAFYLRRY